MKHNVDKKTSKAEVEEKVGAGVNTELEKPLYALGCKNGKHWKLIDYFNSEKKAENALRKSVDNLLRSFIKMEVAMLEFAPSEGVWRVVGKPVKV